MKISDSYAFDAEQQTVCAVLMNPNPSAKAFRGVDRLIRMEGETNAGRAAAKSGLAAAGGTYNGPVRMSKFAPPNQYRLTINGEGQASIINGSALLNLSFDAEK